MSSLKFLLIFFAALFFGCATAPKPVINEAMTADELCNRLLQTTGSVKDFSAEGSITIITPMMNQSAGFELYARGTDSVKISVYGPFGITVGTALFTRLEFTAYNALNNTVYRGSPEKQMHLLPFIKDIPFELLMGSLQGVHPFRFSQIDSFEMKDGRTYSFTGSYDDGSFDRFEYGVDTQHIMRCTRKDNAGNILWSIGYWYQRIDGGMIVPEQIEVNVPSKGTHLVMEYSSVTYDTLSSALTISFPEDAEIITIE